MIRATTPKQVFTFKIDPSAYTKILITYTQDGHIVLEKYKSDLTIEPIIDAFKQIIGYAAWFRMSQEEANMFKPGPSGKLVSVQVRVKTTSGEVLASEKKNFSVQDVLNDEVL